MIKRARGTFSLGRHGRHNLTGLKTKNPSETSEVYDKTKKQENKSSAQETVFSDVGSNVVNLFSMSKGGYASITNMCLLYMNQNKANKVDSENVSMQGLDNNGLNLEDIGSIGSDHDLDEYLSENKDK